MKNFKKYFIYQEKIQLNNDYKIIRNNYILNNLIKNIFYLKILIFLKNNINNTLIKSLKIFFKVKSLIEKQTKLNYIQKHIIKI